VILAGLELADAARQLDLTLFAEVCAGLARRGIEGDEPPVVCRDEDAAAARLARGARRVEPGRDAAARESFGVRD